MDINSNTSEPNEAKTCTQHSKHSINPIYFNTNKSKYSHRMSSNPHHNGRNDPRTPPNLNMDPLDDAMRELLDICKNYNDAFTQKTKRLLQNDETTETKQTSIKDLDMLNNLELCDNSQSNATKGNKQIPSLKADQADPSGSIERLQHKQSFVQSQLDEVLQVAKKLASRHQRHSQTSLGSASSSDDDDELIEFQKIENELRISDLNRQLDNIQEELRIRLYKRLTIIANPKSDVTTIATRNEESSPSSSSSVHTSSFRSSSINGDLERIDEDEEDVDDSACKYDDSDRFRAIYEEKLSPILHQPQNPQPQETNTDVVQIEAPQCGTDFDANAQNQLRQNRNHRLLAHVDSQELINSKYQRSPISIRKAQDNTHMIEATRQANRPLTIYMPKRDEQIDLVEHVQALGHDLNLISGDLSVEPKRARGYLWKSCANNSKKWLRRYFVLDRETKTLAYYHSEQQLVKRPKSPKSFMFFDDICDVYVDHRMSASAFDTHTEDNKSDKTLKKSKQFVFVLATLGRKFLLASRRAETMRAWIDIIFTAANPDNLLGEADHDTFNIEQSAS